MNVMYFQWGRRAQKPRAATALCGTCVPTAAVTIAPLGFDSEKDANTAFRLFWAAFFTTGGKLAWDAAWTAFRCTNPQCSVKKPCGNRPRYIEVGAETTVGPGPIEWRLYLYLERRIQCVPRAPGAPPIEDVPPEFPDPDRPWDPPPDEPEPNEPEAPPAPPKPGATAATVRRTRRGPGLRWEIGVAKSKPSRKRTARRRGA